MLTRLVLQESQQKVITLKEDDPEAVEEILRKLYGCTLPEADTKPWRFWFNLIVAADKYLEKGLCNQGFGRLKITASKETDADAIFDIIQAIKTELAHLGGVMNFSAQLRKQHLKILLDNERFRELLDGDKKKMWAQLDELKALAWPEQPKDIPGDGFVRKRHFVCPVHHSAFNTRASSSTEAKTEGPCTICHPDKPKNGVEQIFWVSK